LDIQTLSVFAEIVSSLAIVATLVYLGVQARQTNELLIGGSRQASLEADLAFFSANISNPEVSSRILGISPEQMQENSLLNILMRTREYQWFQYRSGSLDRGTFESYMLPTRRWLTTEKGAAFWQILQVSFDPEFVKYINVSLAAPAAD